MKEAEVGSKRGVLQKQVLEEGYIIIGRRLEGEEGAKEMIIMKIKGWGEEAIENPLGS